MNKNLVKTQLHQNKNAHFENSTKLWLVNKLAKSLLKNCGKSMQELTVSIKYFPDIFEQWDDYATF